MKKFRLNIQMFATDIKTAGKTTTYAGIANVDDAHEFVDRALEESIYEEYDLYEYADEMSLPKNNGTTMVYRKLSKYDANINELTEGVYPTEDAPMKIYEYRVSLKDYGGFTSYTDKIDIYALNNGWAARISKNQGNSVGEKFQYKVRDAFYSSPNKWFAGVASPSGKLSAIRSSVTGFQLDDLRKIKTKLKRMKVKPYANGDYVILVSPEVAQSLLTLKKSGANDAYTFVEVMKYTDTEPLFKGEVGRWSGFRIVEHDAMGQVSNVSAAGVASGATTSGGSEVHGCVVLGKYNNDKGLKLVKLAGMGKPESIIKPLGSAGSNDPLNQKGTVGWKMMGWGAKIIYAEAVMVYECAADIATASEFPETSRETYSTGTDGNAGTIASTKASTGTIKNGVAGVPYTNEA